MQLHALHHPAGDPASLSQILTQVSTVLNVPACMVMALQATTTSLRCFVAMPCKHPNATQYSSGIRHLHILQGSSSAAWYDLLYLHWTCLLLCAPACIWSCTPHAIAEEYVDPSPPPPPGPPPPQPPPPPSPLAQSCATTDTSGGRTYHCVLKRGTTWQACSSTCAGAGRLPGNNLNAAASLTWRMAMIKDSGQDAYFRSLVLRAAPSVSTWSGFGAHLGVSDAGREGARLHAS